MPENKKVSTRAKSRGEKRTAEMVQSLWRNANSGIRTRWQSNEQMSYDFFLGDQLTEEEKEQLRDSGMPDFIINRVTPIIQTMLFFATANNPRWKAVGADGSDSAIAQIHTDVIDYAWYMSNGKSVLAQVLQDSFTKSKGYLHIFTDPNADRGMGEVMFESVNPFHVWVSTRSTDFLERDATYHIIKKDLPRDELLNMLPEFADKIKAATGSGEDSPLFSERDLWDSISIQEDSRENPLRIDGTVDDILQYYEVYKPEMVKHYNLFVRVDANPQELQKLKDGIDAQVAAFAKEQQVVNMERAAQLERQLQDGSILKPRFDLEIEKMEKALVAEVNNQRAIMTEKAKEVSSKIEQRNVTADEYEKIFKNDPAFDIVQAIPYYKKNVKKMGVAGDKLLYETFLNIEDTPLIPIPYLHTGTPCPISAVLPLVGKQQEINKAHQIMIHNANLSGNLRWLYAEGEIDEEEWAHASAPGAKLKYRPGFTATGPREIMPQPINNAFFTVEQDAKSDLEYLAGIQPANMGISQQGDETFRGFLARDENGTRRIRSWMSNVMEPALEHAGKIFTQMAKQVYTIHKVFRIAQPNLDGSFQEKTFEVNIPIFNDKGDVIGKYNDYATTQYDLRVVSGATLPVNRWAILEEYKQYLQMGVIDDVAFLAETDIVGKDQILQRKSMMSQLSAKIEELGGAVEERDNTIQTLTRQLIQAGIKNTIMESSKELEMSANETKMLDRLTQERLRDMLKAAREEAARELKELKEQAGGRPSEASAAKPAKNPTQGL